TRNSTRSMNCGRPWPTSPWPSATPPLLSLALRSHKMDASVAPSLAVSFWSCLMRPTLRRTREELLPFPRGVAPRHLSPLLALLTCVAPGCGQPAIPPEEKPPPATVKWEGPLQSNLEEWTQLVGTTMPLPDRVARITAPIEGRVTWLPTSGQDKSV